MIFAAPGPSLADATFLGGLLALTGIGLLAFLALALLGAFALLLRQLGGGGPGGHPFPYQRAGALFTPAEAAFLPALAQAAGPEIAVFGKVRLADLIQPRAGLPRPKFLRALNRVTSKHVDFVLVDRDTLQPLAAVELDDRSHLRADRQARDRFVEGALAAAGLPLLRFPVQGGGTPEAEIRAQIIAALGTPSPAARAPSHRGQPRPGGFQPGHRPI